MGRKIDIIKINDITKCQVTFSKRRSSLMKKANEIAVCCDVDVAFIAFSPSGRVSKFCNQKRIEDVLHRYVNLPAEKRLNHISNVEGKLEKLGLLSHIKGDTSKLHFLDKQIENLELQIQKCSLELQILETDLRDYELSPEQEPSLHLLSWCERNLNHSLQRVIARKMDLEKKPRTPSIFNENGQVSTVGNPMTGQILMQLDPWISPYNAKVRKSIFQDLLDQPKQTIDGNLEFNTSSLIPSNISSISIEDYPIFESEIQIRSHVQISPPLLPLEQPFMVNQPLLFFHDQNNVNERHNTPPVVFSDATHMSTESSGNIQEPRFTSITTTTIVPNPSSSAEMPRTLDVEMGSAFQSTNSNLNQFSNMEGQQIGGQLSMDQNSSFIEDNLANVDEDHHRINSNEIQKNNRSLDAFLLPEDNDGDSTVFWRSKVQNSSLWEWDDLLLDENFNWQDFV